MIPEKVKVTDEVYADIEPHLRSLVCDEKNRILFVNILEDYIEYPVINCILQRYLDGSEESL